MSYDFQTSTFAKWILAGEHAVIRGHSALIFPFNKKKLTLSYQRAHTLSADYEGCSGADAHLLFWSVIERGVQILDRSINTLNGHFHINSDIPVGLGMGASAALCVAVARWFAAYELVSASETASFAKELEHLFHGQSSGLDIAGVAATSGIHFKQGLCTPLEQTWQPQWFLSSCGQVGITSHCINHIDTLWQENAMTAAEIDKQMENAVIQAQAALGHEHPKALDQLAAAINTAANCFQQWGLISESLQQHMQILRNAGAIAVKPTGSGGGGNVISLWDKTPPQLTTELIQI